MNTAHDIVSYELLCLVKCFVVTVRLIYFCLHSQMVHNVDRVRDYEVGSEFMKYVRRQSQRREELDDYLFEEFDPEAA